MPDEGALCSWVVMGDGIGTREHPCVHGMVMTLQVQISFLPCLVMVSACDAGRTFPRCWLQRLPLITEASMIIHRSYGSLLASLGRYTFHLLDNFVTFL